MESKLVAKMSDSEITRRILKVWFIVQILIGVATSTSETEDAPATLLYANCVDLRMYDLLREQDAPVISNLTRAVAVDYDYDKKIAVWTDTTRKRIYSASLETGESITELIIHNATSYGIAVDWIHDNVYWTDSANDEIGVSQLNGTLRTILFMKDLEEPRAIVLNPFEGWMFWTDWGSDPKIERSGMDGSQRSTIVSSKNVKWPNGLAIDLPARKLYWVDGYKEVLCSSDYDGGKISTIISSQYLNLPFSVDVFEEWAFITEWSSSEEKVFKANKITGESLTVVFDGETTLMGLKVYHASKQLKAPNRCGDDNGGCSYFCLPAPELLISGSPNFTCACPSGMVLSNDGFNCSIKIENQAVLLYANRHDVRKFDLKTKEDTLVTGDLNRATVVDYDFANSIIVWTDTTLNIIYSATLTPYGTDSVIKRTTIATKATSYGIAVDWIHGNVYWTDTLNDVIVVANLNGSMKKTLFNTDLDEPRSIVLSPSEGLMFWTDWGEVPKIERSVMDGTSRTVIISRGIRWPNGLAIDLQLRRIYWIDGKTYVLSHSDYDGKNERVLISSSTVLKHPFTLDVFDDWLYWTEWASNLESIYKANKFHGGSVTKVFTGERSLMGIKVYHESKQPKGTNWCGDDNGGCSHLCLPAPGISSDGATNFTCACPNGLFLSDDGLNCTSNGSKTSNSSQASLICANVNDIRLINVASNESRVLFKGLKRAVGIDYDYAKNVVFWSDVRNDAIYSGSLLGGEVKEIVSNLSIPDGLAVDWIHNTIYWTDKALDSIGVASMDGSYVKTLFKYDIDEPRAISLNPLEGWMFWSDWGRVPKIERSGMDGTHRSVIVSQGVQWPNGLTIDLVLRKIFWADAKAHEICSADFDGSNKHVILSSYSFLKQPFAMDVFEDTMYWVEWRSGEECIYKASKTTGRDITKVVDGRVWSNLMGIRAHHPSKQPQGPNRCGDQNGGCSHLCLPAPELNEGSSNFTCVCPDGLFLSSDGYNCSKQATTTSTTYEPTYAPATTFEYPAYTSSTDNNSTEKAVIIYANSLDIRKFDLETNKSTVLADNFIMAKAVDYHYKNRIAFWTDTGKGSIYSAPLWSGKPVSKLTENNVTSNGIAVDWIHNHIYWTDTNNNSIDVAQLDGSMRKTLFNNDIDEPRSIVVNPLEGWIFWADWGRVPKIERSGMDGTYRSVIVDRGVDWTHGLAIDFEVRKIYWANGESKAIYSANYDGSNVKDILFSPEKLHLPFSIDVFQDWIFWTEFLPGHEKIWRFNKVTSSNVTEVAEGHWPELMSIRIYHASKQPEGENLCGDNNGGCSHLCLPAPQQFIDSPKCLCACPDGMFLSLDGVHCSTEDTTGYNVITSDHWPDSTLPTFTYPRYVKYSTPSIEDSGSSESTINPDVYNEESQRHTRDGTGVSGITIGVLCALALIALVGFFVYYRKYFRRGFGNTIFNNPVYRRHLEDEFCLEKNALSARESMEPLTMAEVKESV